MRAVAVLFTAGPSELGIEPGSEKSLNKYLFQGEEKQGDVGMSQEPREGWDSHGALGWQELDQGAWSQLHWSEVLGQGSGGQS